MLNELDEKKRYYISTFDKKLKEFKEVLKIEDYNGLKKFGHKIKGTGKSFGFEEISEIGKKIEDSSINNDTKSLENFYKELKDLFYKIKTFYNIKK